MAITTVSMTVPRKDRNGRTPFSIFFTSADLSGCEEILAMPSGANGIYIEHLKVASAVNLTWTLGAGETTGAVTTAAIGPVEMNLDVGTPSNARVQDNIFDHKFEREILLGAAMTIDASASGTVWGIVEGYSC